MTVRTFNYCYPGVYGLQSGLKEEWTCWLMWPGCWRALQQELSHWRMQNHLNILTTIPSHKCIVTECKLAAIWHLARCWEATEKQSRLHLIV